MKAKIRRLEEDNLKKEKEIDSLLNPQKVNLNKLKRHLFDRILKVVYIKSHAK